MFVFDIVPCPAPRMTNRDRWNPAPRVVRYFHFRDNINHLAEENNYILGESLKIVFLLPITQSWSAKKKAAHLGKPHKAKPDLDNLIKAFTDCLAGAEGDQAVWSVNAQKYWSETGKIIVLEETESFVMSDLESAVWVAKPGFAVL